MKEELRTKYLSIRKHINNKEFLDSIVYKKIINNYMVNNAKLILIYVSYNNEVDTYNLIKYFLEHNILVAVPKIVNDQMNFYYIKSLNELRIGKYNIMEPISSNIVNDYTSCVSITPGICFSYDMYRIGYGKGYYDKFYSQHSNIYKIGITYDECICNKILYDEYDQKLDEIISPTLDIKSL